jgi:hypothetical protein
MQKSEQGPLHQWHQLANLHVVQLFPKVSEVLYTTSALSLVLLYCTYSYLPYCTHQCHGNGESAVAHCLHAMKDNVIAFCSRKAGKL